MARKTGKKGMKTW